MVVTRYHATLAHTQADVCFVPEFGAGQGSFRAQRDEFLHGKAIVIAPESYRTR